MGRGSSQAPRVPLASDHRLPHCLPTPSPNPLLVVRSLSETPRALVPEAQLLAALGKVAELALSSESVGLPTGLGVELWDGGCATNQGGWGVEWGLWVGA